MMMPSIDAMMLIDNSRDVSPTPEMRRMEMFNRARRDELDYLLNRAETTRAVPVTSSASAVHSNMAVRALEGLRDGIGNVLIAAGNRIHSAA